MVRKDGSTRALRGTQAVHSEVDRRTLNTLRYADTEKWKRLWVHYKAEVAEQFPDITPNQRYSKVWTRMKVYYRNENKELWLSLRNSLRDEVNREYGWTDKRLEKRGDRPSS